MMNYKAYPKAKDTKRKSRKGSRSDVFLYNKQLGKKKNKNQK